MSVVMVNPCSSPSATRPGCSPQKTCCPCLPRSSMRCLGWWARLRSILWYVSPTSLEQQAWGSDTTCCSLFSPPSDAPQTLEQTLENMLLHVDRESWGSRVRLGLPAVVCSTCLQGEKRGTGEQSFLSGGGKKGREDRIWLECLLWGLWGGPWAGVQFGSAALPMLVRYCLLAEQCCPCRVCFRQRNKLKWSLPPRPEQLNAKMWLGCEWGRSWSHSVGYKDSRARAGPV